MKLQEIDFQQFEKDMYSHYIALFPKEERKSKQRIKTAMEQETMKIMLLLEQEEKIGFMIINSIKDSSYILLDYFAILPPYQSKGYGSKAIEALKKYDQKKTGIFIEVEKPGLGKDETENRMRQKRIQFYERLGFYKTNYEIELFSVLFVTYVVPCGTQKIDEKAMLEQIISIYQKVLGKERFEENCKIKTQRKEEEK